MTEVQRTERLFDGQDILSVRQFSRSDLAHIFRIAHDMREVVARIGSFDLCRGKVLANLFYEPSTRTSASFVAAMERLGGSVIAINEVRYSSIAKGESLPDTVRTLEAYADVLVIRHPEVGAAAEAAKWCKKPVINAGDGVGEHPTQALLDLFTIREELGRIEGLTVTMLGDLRHGRTVHSLARLLSLYPVKLQLVSPPELAMPSELLRELDAAGVQYQVTTKLESVLADSDVVYATRVQKERFADPVAYESLKDAFCITTDTMKGAKEKMALLHPFPRVGEIDMAVDEDPRAAYFRQIEYGLFVRMALLAMVLGRA